MDLRPFQKHFLREATAPHIDWDRQLDTGLQMRLGRALGNLACTRRRVMRHGSRKMLWSKPEQIADEGAFRGTLI